MSRLLNYCVLIICLTTVTESAVKDITGDTIQALHELSLMIRNIINDCDARFAQEDEQVTKVKISALEKTKATVPPEVQGLLNEIQILEDEAAEQQIDVSTCLTRKEELRKISDTTLKNVTDCTSAEAEKLTELIDDATLEIYGFQNIITDLNRRFVLCNSISCVQEIYDEVQEQRDYIDNRSAEIIRSVETGTSSEIIRIVWCYGEGIANAIREANDITAEIKSCINDKIAPVV